MWVVTVAEVMGVHLEPPPRARLVPELVWWEAEELGRLVEARKLLAPEKHLHNNGT